MILLPLMILIIITAGIIKKVPIYEEFVDGAKDGFSVSVKIIPYLVALIAAISMFKASGAMDLIANCFGFILDKFAIPADIIPIIITRPLSGSAALGLFSELASSHGADAFVTKMAAIMLGSSETTFYVLTVYFGAVGIRKFRYALLTGILSDVVSIVLAIWAAHLFFPASIG